MRSSLYDAPRRRAPRSCALILCATLILAGLARAESFTRVTNPSNPVVTDAWNSGGGSWIDLDNDGDLELFVANGNLVDQKNSLYWNLGGGAFRRVTTGPVVNDGGFSIGGAWGDYDHDGKPDLFVTNRNNFGNFLYRGLGDSLFAKITTGPVVTDISNSNSASWCDLDRDGALDLYVVNFQAKDFLYRNLGAPGFTFASIDTAGLLAGNGFSIPGAWADYDNDGDSDLFVGFAGNANDVLYRNGGGFAFAPVPFADGRSTLGASWGDCDNDGDLDLIATSYLNQKSILYRNAGAPSYALVPDLASPVSNVAANAVGSGWGDYDNDGDLDLFLATDGQHSLLFENGGPPSYAFTRITSGALVDDVGSSFGCVWGDYDGDGQLDLFVANQQNQVNFLFHNDGNANHWLTLRLDGTLSNRSAIGARVRVNAVVQGTRLWQTQEVEAQTGYNSANLDLHFGLDQSAVADSVRIDWPSGRTDLLVAVPGNQLLRVVEGTNPVAVELGGADGPARLEAIGTSGVLRVVLPGEGIARLQVYDASGREVRDLEVAGIGDGRIDLERAGALSSGVYLCRLSYAVLGRPQIASTRLVRVR
ncbi:MAG: FG-GAP-like repeat-containing protein [Candidatus Eisenbacteria bacterium]